MWTHSSKCCAILLTMSHTCLCKTQQVGFERGTNFIPYFFLGRKIFTFSLLRAKLFNCRQQCFPVKLSSFLVFLAFFSSCELFPSHSTRFSLHFLAPRAAAHACGQGRLLAWGSRPSAGLSSTTFSRPPARTATQVLDLCLTLQG